MHNQTLPLISTENNGVNNTHTHTHTHKILHAYVHTHTHVLGQFLAEKEISKKMTGIFANKTYK